MGKSSKWQKNRGVTNLCNSLVFSLSGQKDSNLRPPAPKAGALAGLRHTPKKKTMQPSSSFFRGEGGIRTPGTHCWIRQFSKLLVSATHPPLLGCELRCKSRHFSITHQRFLKIFFFVLCNILKHNILNVFLRNMMVETKLLYLCRYEYHRTSFQVYHFWRVAWHSRWRRYRWLPLAAETGFRFY